jgi:hypothetical protein
MRDLPDKVIIGHRTWKVRSWAPSKAGKREGLCNFNLQAIFIRTRFRTAHQKANILLHEIFHAAWEEAALLEDDGEERIVTVLANAMTQVIRDNPEVFDWIAEKARS